MSDTLSCALCGRDPDTGETFCTRFGEWVAKCPKQDGPLPCDAERDVTDGNDDGEDKEARECA